ncbi:IPI1 [Candida oxycetoniae]|uniref:Ribosome-recycling factor, mitochondrial n=1 Tax=Candida oxycetoniae TaxID=497107 RepID=A0AAI9T062_9ASCO|nr:IPI1 [Candida oxycetoniae]KAI3406002.2 IPI1 [Candida oxycetoniae]
MASKRKQKEKQKDFKKAKLKVGKTAQKPDNYTDISFKSKTITLPGQSITTVHITGFNDLAHQLSLTKHYSSSTRKEVLTNITQNLPSSPSAYKQIISSVIPLILDESKQVRMELMSLLAEIGLVQPGLLDLHKRSIVLFIISAMTHIQPDIRNTSTQFLNILIKYADLKSYFVKILRNFFVLMTWSLKDDSRSKSVLITTSSSILLGANSKKARVNHLQALSRFLEMTLKRDFGENTKCAETSTTRLIITTHPQTEKYLFPSIPQAFAPLNLFGNEMKSELLTTGGSVDLKELDSITTEDINTRLSIMRDVFKDRMLTNLNGLSKEGGEVGRELAAPSLRCLGTTRPMVSARSFLPNHLLCSNIHTSSSLFAKKKSKGKGKHKKSERENELDESDEYEGVTPTIDFRDATDRFESYLSKFRKSANEIKLGKLNPKIFDGLMINVGNNKDVQEVPFPSVAQTSVRGRNFIITTFDPSNAQSIINAIIGSGLNMSGTVDPQNKMNIKIPLPPITQETKQNSVKLLKQLFEKTKSNKTGSLASVRGDIRQNFNRDLKHHKISDYEKEQLNELEKLHKSYLEKLHDAFVEFEKSILN